jgi:hypothetical protein
MTIFHEFEKKLKIESQTSNSSLELESKTQIDEKKSFFVLDHGDDEDGAKFVTLQRHNV